MVHGIDIVQSCYNYPRKRARAKDLLLDERTTSITSLNTNERIYWEEPVPYFNTQFQILKGRALGRRAIQKLDLVNKGLPTSNQTDLLSSVSALRLKLTDAVRSAVTSPPNAEASAPDENAKESATIAAFMGGVEVTPIKGTRLVEVSYDSIDPQFATTAVNTVVAEYIAQNLDIRLRNIDSTLEWLTEQLKAQQAKLTAAEQAMLQYRVDKDALSLDNRQDIVG